MFLRGVPYHYFNMKKSAAKSHRILAEITAIMLYLNNRVRGGFVCFQSANAELEDNERSGKDNTFEDKEFISLLNVPMSNT